MIHAARPVSSRIASTASATFARSRYRVRGEASFARNSASRRHRPLDPLQPRRRVQLGLARAVIPDQPVPLGAGRLRLVDREPVDQLPVVVVLVVDPRQWTRPAQDLGAEGGVLAAGAGQDAQEPAAVLMDVGHVLGGGELAVGDVEEVAAAGQLAEEVPGVAVRAVVGGVAALDPELHRHGAVAGDREDVKQLLEVGAMVLVVAPGDGQAEPAPQGPLLIGGLVIAVEGDGGGVVVQLVEFDAELADGVGDDGEGEGGDVGVEEAVEAAADAVVVERGELFGGQAEESGDVARGPLADAVEGLAGDEEVLEQEQQPGGGGDARAAVLAREVVAEDRLEAESVEEAVEDRQGGDGVRVEGAARGASDPAGPERCGGPAGLSGRSCEARASPRCVVWPRSPRQPVGRLSDRHDRGEGEKVKGRKILRVLM